MERNIWNFIRIKIIQDSWIVLTILLFEFSPAMAGMQSRNDAKSKSVKGIVISREGKPLSDVTIIIKGTDFTSLTDQKGQFTLSGISDNSILVFSKNDYGTVEVPSAGQTEFKITLNSEKYVNLLWMRQNSKLVTEAVSSIDGEDLKDLPGMNRNNLLGGRITGLTVQQNNGEPGLENSALYIRGLRTLGGAKQSPYILVDGYWRDNASYINPYDIESISVLKDAASTAMYGLRGSNGVVLITTKRGKEEPVKVSLDAKYGLQTPTRIPKYLDSYNYAYLYNEALRNGGGVDKYDATALEAYRTGSDPYHYPNVDWGKEFLKNYSTQQDYNLSIRGGNKMVRYYASAGYVDNTGLYNIDKKVNTYNTNSDFKVYRLRSNIDVQVSKNLLASMEMGFRQEIRNYPGLMDNSANRIFTALYQLPPNVFPIFNEDGSVAGNTQYTNNPYALLNNNGYSIYNVRNTDAAFKLKYDLSDLLKGLSARASVAFDSYFEQTINRNKGFVVYEGSLANERGVKNPATQQNTSTVGDNQRIFDMLAGLDYDRTFGKHSLTGTVFANQTTYEGDGSIMPHNYQGIMGRAGYVFDNRFIAGFSFAYQGSEQISDNQRFQFFPAVSAGFILADNSAGSLFNFLKIRGSHGLTGNDSAIGYFQKLYYFEKSGNYLIGDNLSSYPQYREGVMGNPDIISEKTQKSDLGIDGVLCNNHFNFSADVFYEKTKGIIVDLNRIPTLLGALNVPKGNEGTVENKGFEVQLGYNNKLSEFRYGAMGNFSFARNKIIDQEEQDHAYSYNYATGHPIGSQFGLQALGFFKDDADISASPLQTYGTVRPGDIKYKDVTKDGKIDIDDISCIGNSWMPEIVYGLTLNLGYKGFDISALIEGVDQVEKKLTGSAYWEFYPNGLGKVMEHHLDRWAYYPELGIDTRETATYPRLSLEGDNTNNKAPNSTFWLKDASYTRLKSVEIGYSLPAKLLKNLQISKLRIYATGYNLLTFDKIKVIDPESPGNGIAYPIQRIINLGLTAQF
jgi:TonB-linked SusC/RagA family outer membrane protein